jgi:hypothetical protein
LEFGVWSTELLNQQSLELSSEHTASFNPQNHKISKNPEPFNIREYHGIFWCLICLKMCHAPPVAQSRAASHRAAPSLPPQSAAPSPPADLPRRHPPSPPPRAASRSSRAAPRVPPCPRRQPPTAIRRVPVTSRPTPPAPSRFD